MYFIGTLLASTVIVTYIKAQNHNPVNCQRTVLTLVVARLGIVKFLLLTPALA